MMLWTFSLLIEGSICSQMICTLVYLALAKPLWLWQIGAAWQNWTFFLSVETASLAKFPWSGRACHGAALFFFLCTITTWPAVYPQVIYLSSCIVRISESPWWWHGTGITSHIVGILFCDASSMADHDPSASLDSSKMYTLLYFSAFKGCLAASFDVTACM